MVIKGFVVVVGFFFVCSMNLPWRCFPARHLQGVYVCVVQHSGLFSLAENSVYCLALLIVDGRMM